MGAAAGFLAGGAIGVPDMAIGVQGAGVTVMAIIVPGTTAILAGDHLMVTGIIGDGWDGVWAMFAKAPGPIWFVPRTSPAGLIRGYDPGVLRAGVDSSPRATLAPCSRAARKLFPTTIRNRAAGQRHSVKGRRSFNLRLDFVRQGEPIGGYIP